MPPRDRGETATAGYGYATEFELGLDLILDGRQRLRAALIVARPRRIILIG